MAEVGKRPHPDFDASQALVKRQKTDESALIVGSITKDVSWRRKTQSALTSGVSSTCDLDCPLLCVLQIRMQHLTMAVAVFAGHSAYIKSIGPHHAAGGAWW
jgi:hypothetical protein